MCFIQSLCIGDHIMTWRENIYLKTHVLWWNYIGFVHDKYMEMCKSETIYSLRNAWLCIQCSDRCKFKHIKAKHGWVHTWIWIFTGSKVWSRWIWSRGRWILWVFARGHYVQWKFFLFLQNMILACVCFFVCNSIIIFITLYSLGHTMTSFKKFICLFQYLQ